MSYRILRQATVGLRPTQVYVHEAGNPISFRTYKAAQAMVTRLKTDQPHDSIKFTIVGTKH